MPRAVLDTSVLVSAFLTPHGSVVRLLREPARSQDQLCFSEYILTETADIFLSKTRLRNYTYVDTDVRDFIHWLLTHAEMVAGLPELRAVPDDPKDDP
jgi:predicted nucleic acid-binding protein